MASMESAADQVRGESPGAPPAVSRGYRSWLLFLLLLANVLNLADRQGMAAAAPAIKRDLRLSDTQLGLIMGFGFALFYSLLGLPYARLAERGNRARILAASVAAFGVMAALCSRASSFAIFLLFRMGVGIGDAGLNPPTASLIGDHYPREKRTSAMTVVWLGAPIGAMGGSILGGWFAQNLGWRVWFLALGVPALVLSLIMFLTLREPRRGAFDPAGSLSSSPPGMGKVLRFLLAKRSMLHVMIGAALAATAMNGLGQFLARFFVADYHLSLSAAGRMLGLIAGVSMASGLAIGGFGMDRAARRDRRWYVWGPAIGLVIACPMFLFGVSVAGVPLAVALLLLGHVSLFVYYTPTLALAQNMVGADMRASSSFVISLMLGLVGIGLGPTLVGILSDVFAGLAFPGGHYASMCPGGVAPAGATADLANACATASAAGIKHSIMAMSLLFVWAGGHYLLASRHLRQDLDTHYKPVRA